MKTVYYKGKPMKLTKEIGNGQEAIVYDGGNGFAVKVYREPSDSYYKKDPGEKAAAKLRLQTAQSKLKQYPTRLPQKVITPRKLVTNKRGTIVGFAMEFIKDALPLIKYTNRDFRETSNISQKDMVDILLDAHDTITKIHAHQDDCIVSDLNDKNIVIRNKHAYFIDTDSYGFKGFRSNMFTQGFIDPLLCEVMFDADNNKKFVLSKKHTKMGDWYSFNVLVFKCLLYTSPYGGIYKPAHAKDKIAELMRPHKRITVFHPDVRYPGPALPLDILPKELLTHFKDVFVHDKRIVFPKKLLENLTWTTCNDCFIPHANIKCPKCSTSHPSYAQAKTSYSGTVKALSVHKTTGRFIESTFQDGKLRYLYHENSAFMREGGRKISDGDLHIGIKYRIHGDKTVFGSKNTCLVLGETGTSTKITVDKVGQLPIFDTNENDLYWIQAGKVMKQHPFGLAFEHKQLGNVITDQSLLWTDKDWGFGFWRASNISQGFIFGNSQSIIKEITLPAIEGSILDAKTVFSSTLAWFMYSSQIGSDRINTCHIIDRNGEVLHTIQTPTGSDHWLGNIRGKDASGTQLFSPSDEGLKRIEWKHGSLEEKTFPDTQRFIHSSSKLHMGNNGLFVRNAKEILFLTIS